MEQYIFGHRGASAYAPENTLEAFELAAKMGAHGVELDVHICRSGELVVTHDETVERVSEGEGRVADMTLSELKALHFNRTHPEYKDARIPTLQEVFRLLRPTGMRINIELKNSQIDYPELEKRVLLDKRQKRVRPAPGLQVPETEIRVPFPVVVPPAGGVNPDAGLVVHRAKPDVFQVVAARSDDLQSIFHKYDFSFLPAQKYTSLCRRQKSIIHKIKFLF